MGVLIFLNYKKINNYGMIYIGIVFNWANHVNIFLRYFLLELTVYFYIDFNMEIKQTMLKYY